MGVPTGLELLFRGPRAPKPTDIHHAHRPSSPLRPAVRGAQNTNPLSFLQSRWPQTSKVATQVSGQTATWPWPRKTRCAASPHLKATLLRTSFIQIQVTRPRTTARISRRPLAPPTPPRTLEECIQRWERSTAGTCAAQPRRSPHPADRQPQGLESTSRLTKQSANSREPAPFQRDASVFAV